MYPIMSEVVVVVEPGNLVQHSCWSTCAAIYTLLFNHDYKEFDEAASDLDPLQYAYH